MDMKFSVELIFSDVIVITLHSLPLVYKLEVQAAFSSGCIYTSVHLLAHR